MRRRQPPEEASDGTCTGCGSDLPEEYCTQPRVACPHCGATGRTFSMTAQDGVAVGGASSWVQTRPGIQSTAQLTDCGKLTLDATAPAPRNEEDALAICHRLVQVVNSSGGRWSAPVAGHQDIDAESMNTDEDRLQMQVVRATEDTSFWRELNVSGTASREYNATSAAAQLLAIVRKKASKYASAQKKVLTLVLDAARSPNLTLSEVVTAFRAAHLAECQEAGFRAGLGS